MDTAELFIQIASYRDPQLGPTVADLLARARHPERLRLGICLQTGDADGEACGVASLPGGEALRGAELRLDCTPAETSRGCCWARARTQRLWRGEPFTLQIDSHMRVVPDWDVELVAMWRRCEDPAAMISGYPNAFTLPEQCDTAQLPLLAPLGFDAHDGLLRQQGINTFANPRELPDRPLPGALIGGCMLFGPGRMIEEVPYDPDLYFYGEEISLALRLWTSGFNLYNPDRVLIFHLYKAAGLSHITHWAEHPDWDQLNQRSVQRLQALIQGDGLEEPYGLGRARSLQSWQQWSGIDLVSRQISPEAWAGCFRPPPACSGVEASPA
ncbi:hypothetical protein KBZ20_15950 [Vulcanococcus limneticus Candia 3F8]|uniref:GlcNAc-transferase family protein n=1 Tax=Vulcanococcus limneticus TaxID=2170428 RepID=UPI000B9831A4|nr:GlcNAc-transferase family protein [Vulcanococcus limneticus]MCP9793289.1 hypothetical protein [Vulcanococcus limneticus MW73D5]MCP9895264.1 hypothetical protein [Vulcanococcus limneticus Candia 3F8]MCP9898416.1 hypothetical protein [Vulcanococcus limneticus Candia 3B3]